MRIWNLLLFLGLAALLWGGNPPSTSQNPISSKALPNKEANQTGATKRDLEIVEQKLTNALAAQKNDFDRRLLPFDNWMTLLGGCLGLSLLGSFLAVKKYEKRRLDMVEKRLEKITERKLSLIHQHLNTLDYEREVKERWRILILANSEDFTALGLLEGLGFKCLVPKPYPALSNLDIQGHEELGEDRVDLVLFDQLDEEHIDCYVELSSKPLFVAYSPRPGRVNVKAQYKINFANSPMTLYNRIIEAARYQKSLIRSA